MISIEIFDKDGVLINKIFVEKENSVKISEPISEPISKPIYQMCQQQLAQIDCRNVKCKWYEKGGVCTSHPAITLNKDNGYVCWGKKE